MEQLPFYNPDLGREASEPSSKGFLEVIDLLRSDELHNLAAQGNLSLAMIRPNVGPEANLLGLNDLEAAEEIERQIEGLGVLAKFSFTFDPDTIEIFYEGPSKEAMKERPAQRSDDQSKWEEFKDFMCSGPTTVLLLFSDTNNAIEKWRDHLGHWNIEKTRDPLTIRGRLGVDNFNNLVHGSDAPESVLRELGLIAQALEKE